MQDYVIYEDTIDRTAVIKEFAKNPTQRIIFSNLTNPLNVQIQLKANVAPLDKLMEDLELCYCGIGASNYDMPDEYILEGRLCAVVYTLDNNWHRAKIVDVNLDKRQARVEFIDYGGELHVNFKNIKFLDKRFGDMPAQVRT